MQRIVRRGDFGVSGRMRLLHTADWHIGKRLYGNDRLEETRQVLDEVARVATAAEVDAILVAGDNLDRRLVEPAVLATCLRAFEALAAVAPVVAVTGNHEDPAFWQQIAPYLAPSIRLVTSDELVTIETRSGPLAVACLPWPDPVDVSAEPGDDRARTRQRYATLVRERIQTLSDAALDARSRDGGVAVLLGHLMVNYGVSGGGERELTLGGTYAVDGAAFPTALDYVALGHLHRPQQLPGYTGLGRYAGSPLALDFSGDGAAPSVAIVDVGQGRGQVTEVPLESGRRLVRLRGTLDEIAARAGETPDAWFFCEVDVDQIRLDLVHEVRDRIPGALRIEPRLRSDPSTRSDEAAADEPRDVADTYAEWRALGGRPNDRVVAAFRAALAHAEELAE